MKKITNQNALNSKVGKSWTLDSASNNDSEFLDNFIIGMTNQKSEINKD